MKYDKESILQTVQFLHKIVFPGVKIMVNSLKHMSI